MGTTHEEGEHIADEKPEHENKKLTVTIIYNGVPKPFEVEPRAAVQSLLARAIAAFGSHELVLGWPDGREVDMSGSIAHAGIIDGTQLLLRPDKVRGGRW